MQIQVSASDIKSEKRSDDRGRVTLGSEYADRTVTVAVLEVEDEDDVRTDEGEDNDLIGNVIDNTLEDLLLSDDDDSPI